MHMSLYGLVKYCTIASCLQQAESDTNYSGLGLLASTSQSRVHGIPQYPHIILARCPDVIVITPA